MKQRITVKQLTELTHEQKLELHAQWNPQRGDFYAWYKSKGAVDKESYLVRDTNGPFDDPEVELFALPLLSIGQMIELLQMEGQAWKMRQYATPDHNVWTIDSDGTQSTEELCDALWQAVKTCL